MTTSSPHLLSERRVWNPSTQGLPAPMPQEHDCARYWGLRGDAVMSDWMLRLRRMVARKVPRVHALDQRLRYMNMASMRVQGVASEQRANRTIVGIDINGACSYAVAHVNIPDPLRLEHRKDESDCHPDDPRWSGFYLIEAHASKFWCTPPILSVLRRDFLFLPKRRTHFLCGFTAVSGEFGARCLNAPFWKVTKAPRWCIRWPTWPTHCKNKKRNGTIRTPRQCFRPCTPAWAANGAPMITP